MKHLAVKQKGHQGLHFWQTVWKDMVDMTAALDKTHSLLHVVSNVLKTCGQGLKHSMR
jgi:hypothetical protein